MTDFYIVDRTFKLQTIVSSDGETNFKVTNALDTLNLETASRRMEMDIAFTPNTSRDLAKFTAVGNYCLYYDVNNTPVFMTILKASHKPLEAIRSLELESASLDLLNETVGEYKATTPQSVAFYINMFCKDSGFTIGKNEISNYKRTLEWEGTSTTLERVLSVVTQFDAELEFRFEFNGNHVVKWIMDIRKKRGNNTTYKLYVNKDIHSIDVETDIYSLYNAVNATGGTPEGSDKPITLKGYNWTDPDGRFKLDKNSGIIRDTANIKQWRRPNSNDGYFLQQKDYQATTQKTLLESALADLKKYSEPQVNYTVDIANLPYNLNVGDYLYIVDENEELYLNSRVLKLEYQHTTDRATATLGDFLIVESGISDRLQQLANDLENKISQSQPFEVIITPSAPFFVNGEGTITLEATVKRGGLDVTSSFHTFTWSRYKLDGSLDTDWSDTGQTIDITAGTELRYTYEVLATNE